MRKGCNTKIESYLKNNDELLGQESFVTAEHKQNMYHSL